MSVLFSAGLQASVYQRLAGDAVLAALVGTAIHDAPLELGPDDAAGDYVTLGEEAVRANDTKTSRGAVHDFTVTVHSGRDGFDRAKRVAAVRIGRCNLAAVAPVSWIMPTARTLRLKMWPVRTKPSKSCKKWSNS